MYKNKLIFGTGFNDNPRCFSKKKFIRSIYICLDQGLNIFDTADNYFDGDIQKIIGKELFNKNISMINKFQIINDKKILQKNLDNSLKRLKRDKIEFYMPHWPVFDIDYNLVIDFILENIEKKKIETFGLSNFNIKMIRNFKKLYNKKICIQTDLNICNYNYNKDLIKYCNQNSIKIFAYKIAENFPKKILKLNKFKNQYNEYEISLIWTKSMNLFPIIKSLNEQHLIQNIQIFKKKFDKIDFKIKNNFKFIPIKKINKLNSGSNVVYKNIIEAKNNIKKLFPSPKDISEEIKKYGLLKPFFFKKNYNGYELLSGQARFWAYRILFKKKYIKGIIVD